MAAILPLPIPGWGCSLRRCGNPVWCLHPIDIVAFLDWHLTKITLSTGWAQPRSPFPKKAQGQAQRGHGWAGLAACTVWLLDEVWVDLALVSFLTQLHPHHVTFTLWVSASSSVRWCKSSFGRRQTPSSGLSQTRARNGLSFLIYCRVSIGHPAEMCIFDKCPS